MMQSTLRPVTTSRINARNISSSFSVQRGDVVIKKDDLVTIKKKVVKIKKLLETSTLLTEKYYRRTRIDQEESQFETREKNLERRKPEYFKDRGFNGISLPKPGFLNRVENFFGSIILGMLGMNLVSQLDKLPGIVKGVGAAIDFGSNILVGTFDLLSTFVEKGYEAYDGTRGFLKNIGGEDLAKKFDQFSNVVNTVLETALIIGLSASDNMDFGGGYGERLTPKKGFDVYGRRVGTEAQERYLARYGEKQFAERFGEKALQRIATKGAEQTIEKGVLRTALRGIPIVGALLDFALNYFVFKESLGESAFRAAGSSLIGVIGGALGSIFPGPGTIIGAALGGVAGDFLASKLYDAIFKGKAPQQKPAKNIKAATGGPIMITRGGKPVGGKASRRVKKQKITRTLRVKPTQIKPGKSVGGEDKIKRVFPDVKKGKDKTVNPYEYIKTSYTKLSSSPGLGGLIALGLKANAGEMPNDVDYLNAAEGLLAFNQRIFGTGVMRTTGYANGGEVDLSSMNYDNDSKRIMAKALRDSLSPSIDSVFSDLKKQLGLEPNVVEKEKSVNEVSPEETLGDASDGVGGARIFMSLGFPMLAAAILSGNIQQESGWKGQRTPWVLNDGAGVNKGILSWNRGRITNAEKFLGKPLETATNAEQAKWIKEELRQYGLLDIFLNPNSTEQQLKDASYKYIGWGDLGDRWKYSSQIFSALQRGEAGTYSPGTYSNITSNFGVIEYITGDKNHPNFELKGHGMPGNYHDHIAFSNISEKEKAKKMLIAAGIKIGSEYRPGDPGFHGKNLAIDIPGYQWGGSGVIGQKEYAGSKKVRQVLGIGRIAPFAKGGRVRKPTYALIGEKGPEFVFDADTTKSLDSMVPGLLEQLNFAKTKREVAQILSSYAGYEDGAEQTIIISDNSSIVPVPIPMPTGSGSMIVASGSNSSSSYDVLYHGH